MSKQNPNKQGRWLIERWDRARQFEDAMETARTYYEELFGKVLEEASKKYRDLSKWVPHKLSKRVTEGDWEDGGGCAGFAKKRWHSDWPRWPSGIWIWNISLDELVTERATAPNASIWLGLKNSRDRRIEQLRQRLLKKSLRVSGSRTLHFQEHDPDSPRTCLWYFLPEDRIKLRDMVLRENGRPFVQCIANHVELMASLLQGLDDLLR